MIVATPNASHAEIGLACIDRGLAVLMEKPVADTVADAQRLCAAAEAANVPLDGGPSAPPTTIVRSARTLIAGWCGRPAGERQCNEHLAQA